MTMLNSLLTDHYIHDRKALRALLERHRRELGGAISEVKRDTLLHQHEVELRLFFIDELLEEPVQATCEPEPGGKRLRDFVQRAKAESILNNAQRIHDQMVNLIDDVRVGYEMVNALMRLGVFTQNKLRSGDPSLAKRLQLAREAIVQIQEEIEQEHDASPENVQEGFENLFRLLKDSAASPTQTALLSQTREQINALMNSLEAFWGEPLADESPVEEPPVEEPPVEEPRADEPPVEESPVEEPPVEEPRADEPPVEEPPVEEPRADEPVTP